MKKAIGLVALLCIVVTLASCGLPDPTITVEMYFQDLNKSDGYLARQIKEDGTLKEFAEDYPGAEQAFVDCITAYLNTFEYEIHKDKTEVDTKSGTAKVYVTLKCVDLTKISNEVSSSEEFENYLGEMDYTDVDEMIVFMFDLMTEEIESGDWTPMTVDTTVELEYDTALKAWVITNEDDIFSGIV